MCQRVLQQLPTHETGQYTIVDGTMIFTPDTPNAESWQMNLPPSESNKDQSGYYCRIIMPVNSEICS